MVGSFLPHVTVSPAVFWQVIKHIHHTVENIAHIVIIQCTYMMNNAFFQLLLQSYSAGFNYANRNSSSEQVRYISR